MCGICGIINLNNKPVHQKLIRNMMGKIKHRGPDDEGIFIDGNVGFGFVRLSILDLSPLGHQPMFDETNRYMIIHNGEVYNYIEIRDELEKKGYQFKSNTDTEVILYSYIAWGDGCLNKFNGMWAFVIYDRYEKKVFASRDRFGVKPFYYYKDNNCLIFASEIKALLEVIPSRITNEEIIYDYIIYNRTDHTKNTFFKNIERLLHGSNLVVQDNKVIEKKWYKLGSSIEMNQIGVNEYLNLLVDSVSLRLRSDVPVGVSLSGGLDSSSITSLLTEKIGKKDLLTFSAVYDKIDETDESEFIELYSGIVNEMYYVKPTADSFFYDHEEFIDTHNEPVNDTGSYIQYKVMQLAKEYIKVILDGQGADEHLAGYHNFFGSYFKELFLDLRFKIFLEENLYYIKNHNSSEAFKYFCYYCIPSKMKKRLSKNIYGSISQDFYSAYFKKSTIADDLYNPSNLRESLLQHFEFKLEHLLKWNDLNSMHFSIESRTPFLDYRIVQASLSLPSNMILRKGYTKFILRESMKNVLPEKIRIRKDKKGFSNPRSIWFRSSLFKEKVNDILNSNDFKNLGFFNTEDCIKKFNSHLNNEKDFSKDIWKWINIYEWNKKFINGTE